jgi:hypothetical protein
VFLPQIRRFSILSLLFFLLLTISILIFFYLVSPLRDPTFQPNSANGGSLVPWLKSLKDSDWLFWSSILAFLLSSNITVVIWQPKLSNPDKRLFYFLVMVISVVVIFCFFYYTFLIYLLTQWLID